MGNTRTKWRCGEDVGALPSPGLPALDVDPSRVRVATVLRNRDSLAKEVAERYRVDAEFASTATELAGVRCGYANPSQLGVDRWLAVVAAWQLGRGPVIVVGAGTAVTVDFVDANGRHEGGHIVPGLRLLGNSLDRQTADVRTNGPLEPCTAPGRDTQTAVSSGTFLMLTAFAQEVVERFSARHGYRAQVFLTGGDAELLASGMSAAVRCVPHLVLDGLGIALP